MHPGVQLSDYPYAITRLTLPTAGDYVLNATFTALETDANTIDTWILIKGTSGNVLFNVALANDGVVSGYGGTISVSNYEFSAAVGTTVDFVVGPKYNWIGDTTGLAATVTAIPEPSTYAALLGLAALGYALLTRRRGRHPSSALAEPIFRETRNPRIK